MCVIVFSFFKKKRNKNVSISAINEFYNHILSRHAKNCKDISFKIAKVTQSFKCLMCDISNFISGTII